MWEAVTAVFSVCVRAGRGGVFTGLGESPCSSLDVFAFYERCADVLGSGDLGHIFLTVSSAASGIRLAGDTSVAATT